MYRTIWLSAGAIDVGRPRWILHPVSCHTPEAVTTVFKCSWGWTQKASETCRAFLQLLMNILPSCIMLVLYVYIYIFLVSPVFLRVVTSDTQRSQWLTDAWQIFEIDFDNFRHPRIWRGRFRSSPSLNIRTTAKENGPRGKHKALNTSLSKVASERGQPVSSIRVSVVTGFQKLTHSLPAI